MSSKASTSRPALAGAVYFGVVFGVAFGLGTLRVLVVEPAVGALAAVLMEAPILLGFSWIIAHRLVSRWIAPGNVQAAALMGLVAFVLLMSAELALSTLVFGESPAGFAAGWTTLPGAVGLASQIAFAGVPIVILLGRSRADRL